MKIRLTCANGDAKSVRVYNADTGEELTSITELTIDTIRPTGHVTATMRVVAELDIVAEARPEDVIATCPYCTSVLPPGVP